jgi:hypothetical protein
MGARKTNRLGKLRQRLNLAPPVEEGPAEPKPPKSPKERPTLVEAPKRPRLSVKW